MNKTAIKNYAVWARVALIEAVKQRAYQYGITEKDSGDPNADSVNGFVLTPSEKQQRQALIGKIREKSYEQVCEETAYTWFNRFAALRFMEVNGYLPTRVRVFTDEENAFKPQILAEAMHLELDGLDLDRVIALTDKNKTDELYKYLLITQCNALSAVLPGMFQKIHDYTELLFPDNLLREGSVIERMIAMIPEEDWTDQVQIIGWLYQYYNTEPKDKVFADLKKNIKISKEKIPAATQLFTPDWIVRYMVENSLGRLWVEGKLGRRQEAVGNRDEAVGSREKARQEEEKRLAESMGWKYYLPEAEQTPEVRAELDTIAYCLNPTAYKVIDPCCGSGHILCYLFDVLMQIYEASGYTARDAAQSILLYNLWGLDIDERAAQLSYFAVMMKARQYDRRFFSRNIQPHVLAIAESNAVDHEVVDYFCKGDVGLKKAMQTIMTELHDAKEYGSILTCSRQDWEALYARFNEIYDDIALHRDEALALLPLVQTTEALSQQYDVVVTNPPYMGGSGMSSKLSDYVKKKYPDSKSDLFAVFIERGNSMAIMNGYNCMVTMQSWMFLSSFEKMRIKTMTSRTITNLMHMDNMVMHIAFGTAVTVFQNASLPGYKGTYNQVVLKDIIDDGDERPKEFPVRGNRFTQVSTDNFSKIPGAPVAYWLSNQFYNIFSEFPRMCEHGKAVEGIKTGENEKYLRYWFELIRDRVMLSPTENSDSRWRAITKGGPYRKWYGNLEYVSAWGQRGEILYNAPGSSLSNADLFGTPSLTWTYLTSGSFSMRMVDDYILHNNKGPACYVNREDQWYLLAVCNSKIVQRVLETIAPTIDCKPGNISNIPVPITENKDPIGLIAKECHFLSRTDWDAFETSWDFQRHPLIQPVSTIAEAYGQWERECDERFTQLKANEEELNRIFIEIYGLQDELTPEVEDRDVTVRKANLQREIKSLISYAVGCMFGRYSMDVEGLILAGQKYEARFLHDPSGMSDGVPTTLVGDYIRETDYGENIRVCTFVPDRDNILPITDDEYFEDDIVTRFVKFVEVVYGKDTLEENLRFIADALGGKSSPRQVIRNYFLNDFYADHLKTYQKRPIYWLFDSGKKNGFKCLIYMHRYQPDTLARIRTDYVHEQQSRYRTAIEDLNDRVESAAPAERVKLNKQLQKIQAQEDELRIYEEKIHHLADQMIAIDLDDGVKVNYAKFEDVLARIK